uniref:DUF3741 domain-containing protein n=1 Tax=Solanum lycopersicum TaxID=4081 RepID=A0A3Q7HRB8_SOLLC|nr:uncharacterized protein LOC101262136 [Solanum lycopersicum]
MLKRQDTLAASGRRQRTPRSGENQHVVKSTGCMSGIIQLISKYQKKTKRITSGIRKQGKVVVVLGENEKNDEVKVRSTKIEADKKERPVALVARLMGLEEIKCLPSPNRKASAEEVKRRKLLEDLGKCNDDLESVRQILNSLKRDKQIGDAVKPPTPLTYCNKIAKPKHNHNGHITQQRIKRLESYEPIDKFTNNAPLLYHMKPKSCSKGMIQSVEEVWNENEWGEKREAGKIGLILQDQIYRDLIEELLKEMNLLISFRSLPFLACKKRLFF